MQFSHSLNESRWKTNRIGFHFRLGIQSNTHNTRTISDSLRICIQILKSVGLLLFIIERWIYALSSNSRRFFRTLISHSLAYKVLLVVFFSSSSSVQHYQVHQKSSCYWLERRVLWLVWVWNEKFTLLHLEQWLCVSFVMHKTFRVGRLCEYVCYSLNNLYERAVPTIECTNKKWKYMNPVSVWIVK